METLSEFGTIPTKLFPLNNLPQGEKERLTCQTSNNKLKKIVAEQLGVNEAEVKNESSFQDDLGADSLDTVELVMALEEAFGCEIPDEDAEKITTVQLAIDYINAHQANRSHQTSSLCCAIAIEAFTLLLNP